MTDQLLGFLKICLLVLLYLFFARVLWAVWSEVRSPGRQAKQPQPQPHAAPPRSGRPSGSVCPGRSIPPRRPPGRRRQAQPRPRLQRRARSPPAGARVPRSRPGAAAVTWAG